MSICFYVAFMGVAWGKRVSDTGVAPCHSVNGSCSESCSTWLVLGEALFCTNENCDLEK